MVRLGNLLTHYHYRLCRFQLTSQAGGLLWSVRTPGAEADLEIFEHENAGPAPLPAGSPFETLRDARRFAGPLPITYGYESASRSLVSVRGIRTHWEPQPVAVDVRRNNFLAPGAVLANAFSIRNVPYRWTRGVRIPLEAA
jgi:hypothetical protein